MQTLTYVIAPVPAIGAILLNLPSHLPHAVTCLDGYPMTQQGRGGTALPLACNVI